MNERSKPYSAILNKSVFFAIVLMLSVFLPVSTTFAHGPKGHADMEFTVIRAAQKGVLLYDRLLTSGKLTESWATDLEDIKVSRRINDNKSEFVVKFSRSKGEPRSAYIFFNDKGEYIGSNFTGK
ncbi:MAG: hypothetical protein H8D96_12605 [Desulfobacterales bacterium]|uniref:Uncharacterized protein n=1 Tax=Candidatus Desulfatibia vada TaxID=2841696 RepID=A0A8J6P004_9BACT|nr:hypothetical protein [Candidatus Desulfatibia vada]MBL6970684.1 hypothetical protein [Desulfobacterales bacterium]